MSATAGLEKDSVSHTAKLVCQPSSGASDYIHEADLFLKYTSANQHALTPESLEIVTAPTFLNLAFKTNFSFQTAWKLILFQVTV